MHSKNKLLVVDDCQTTRTIVKDIFRNSGLTILESTNGNDAISMMMKQHPDLVLLDINMPEKDGLDVLEELIEENYNTPIVIISSDVSNDTKKTCTALGVKEYIEKPLNPAKLKETVEKYLKVN
ncbi:MAG: response regulator [Breznakibacter sp.]